MKVILVTVLVLLQAFYSCSYGAYCWKHKQKKPAIGVFIFVAMSVMIPLGLLFARL